MTTDISSVDALRTRLARAFEVAARSDAEEVIEKWQSKGILLDAAAIRHEHGERIAKAIEKKAVEGSFKGRAYAARVARDLSPPP